MGDIFVGQTDVDIVATVSQDVTGATCLIKYRKPNGATGSLAATITTPETGVITHTVTSTATLDQSGYWTFWAYVTFASGKIGIGEKYRRLIKAEGY